MHNYYIEWNDEDLLANPTKWEKETATNAIKLKEKIYGAIKYGCGALGVVALSIAASNKEMAVLGACVALASGVISIASGIKESDIKKNFKSRVWCFILENRIERGAT